MKSKLCSIHSTFIKHLTPILKTNCWNHQRHGEQKTINALSWFDIELMKGVVNHLFPLWYENSEREKKSCWDMSHPMLERFQWLTQTVLKLSISQDVSICWHQTSSTFRSKWKTTQVECFFCSCNNPAILCSMFGFSSQYWHINTNSITRLFDSLLFQVHDSRIILI